MTLVTIGKQVSMAAFKIFARICSSLEAFLLLRVKISFLVSSDETKFKANNSECFFLRTYFFNANMVIVFHNFLSFISLILIFSK